MAEHHLSEAVLNMYLDGELDAAECGRVEAHLAICAACRSEMAALRQLFEALEELAPVPNLAPQVLARIEPHRRHRTLGRLVALPPHLRWVSPVLQIIAAVALLVWIWTWLSIYWPAVRDALSLQEVWARLPTWPSLQWMANLWPTGFWSDLSQRGAAWWSALLAWPGEIWSGIRSWASRLSVLGDVRVSSMQRIAFGVTLAVLWIIGNTVLLRRASMNGQTVQTNRRV